VHPAFASLPPEEKGFALAAALARTPPAEAARRLTGPAAARCAAALDALARAERPARTAVIAELIALARAPVPAGIEGVHPDWLRERLEAEPDAIIRAVTAGLPDAVRAVAATVLASRGGDARTPNAGAAADAEGAGKLRRAVFGGFVPLTGPGAPVAAVARELGLLSFAALVAELDRRGAELLGISLRGAAPAIVARAAAALEPALARVVIDAASRDGGAAVRDDARRRVASVGKRASAEAVRELGARALAGALAGEGLAAVAAVAQRLPAPLGRVLLRAAAEEQRQGEGEPS
jgi:hypothetical protein